MDGESEADYESETPTLGTTQAGLSGPPRTPSPGERLGRYTVLDRLGAGGMGIVVAAYDPELDRKVAIKLLRPGELHPEASRSERARLIREARALARLDHPHVVSVHDVGRYGDEVFVAMEFVQGQTLGRWLSEAREPQAILDVFRQAGLGLVAAHAAGLAHRDFKPDNVMVGDDSRVRVMDFGLARSFDAVAHADNPATGGLDRGPDLEVTRAGATVGTPAYMAPEQWLGQAVTVASDQFSFCVSLWEALAGERPFEGETPTELALHVTNGTPRPSPPGRGTRRHFDVLRRGLAPNPADRWPSIEALLEALARDPAKRRRRWALVGVAVVAGVVGLEVDGFRKARIVDACTAESNVVDEVWNAESEAAIRDVIVSTPSAFRAETWARVRPRLERWASQWRTVHQKACVAARTTSRDHSLARQTLDCLDEELHRFGTFTSLLGEADPDFLPRIVRNSVSVLESPHTCEDPTVVGSRPSLPSEPETRDAIGEARARLRETYVHQSLAQYDRQGRALEGLAARAESIGWEPLRAEVLLATASHAGRTADLDTAEERAHEAMLLAGRIGYDAIAAKAAEQLTFIVGSKKSEPDRGLMFSQLAEMWLLRAGAGDSKLAALLNSRGAVHAAAGSYEDARKDYERAAELMVKTYGPTHEDVGSVWANLGSMYINTQDYPAALDAVERALEIQSDAYGPAHPYVAQTIGRRGTIHTSMGDTDAGIADLEDSVARIEAALGENSELLVVSLNNLGIAYAKAGRQDDRRRAYERALEVSRATRGDDHPWTAMLINNLASLRHAAGEHDEALEMYAEAIGIWEAKGGAPHPNIALALNNAASIKEARGEWSEARDDFARAVAVREAAFGDDHVSLVASLAGLATTELELGRRDVALEHARRAWAIAQTTDSSIVDQGSAGVALVRALAAAPIDRAEARALGETLRPKLEDPDVSAELRAELDEVLADLASR